MRKTIICIFTSIVVLVLSAFGYYYVKQEELIFSSIPLERDHAFNFDTQFQELFVPVEGGEVHGLLFTTEPSNGVVLFLHGRTKNLNFWGKRANFFLEKNYDVFIIDYRGFGKSSPGLKESWLLEDSLAAYDYLSTRYGENEIIVYGNSLGTGMATWVAAHRHPSKLILESPYYSLLAAAAYTKPYLPFWFVKLLLKYPIQTYQWIDKVSCPIYIFHATGDNTIPFQHGQLLYELAKKNNSQVEFIPLNDGDHNSLFKHEEYQRKMDTILRTPA